MVIRKISSAYTLFPEASGIDLSTGISTDHMANILGFQQKAVQSSFGAMRNPSTASTISSHSTSNSSRQTSNGSFSSSMGPGHIRSQSTHYGRPPPSFSQSTRTRPPNATKARSNTAMSNRSDESWATNPERRDGMLRESTRCASFLLSQNPAVLQNNKLRHTQSVSSLRSHSTRCNTRDSSIATALQKMHIDENNCYYSTNNQAAGSKLLLPPRLSYRGPDSSGSGDSWSQSFNQAVVLWEDPGDGLVAPQTPSHIPIPKTRHGNIRRAPITPSSPSKASPMKSTYLTKDSDIAAPTDWDTKAKLDEVMACYHKIREDSSKTTALEQAVPVYKEKIMVLELDQQRLTSANKSLTTDLDAMREKSVILEKRLFNLTTSLDDQIRAHRLEIDDKDRALRNEVEKLRRDNTDEMDRVLRNHRDEIREAERRAALEIDDKIRDIERKAEEKLGEERNRRLREVQELEEHIAKGDQNKNLALEDKSQEIQNLRNELENLKAALEKEQQKKGDAEKSLADLSEQMRRTGIDTTSTITSLEATVASLRARIHFLESGSKAQSDSFADMESRLQDAMRSAEESKAKLIKEETLRRILFNQVQELKGNIRVMCRVRPVPSNNSEGEVAQVKFPDIDKESKELEIMGKEEKSSLGTVTRKTHAFSFDRVFGPNTQNEEVFGEISQLVQSALDGYNVCIFCYGQTGSGKTHTMSSADGMIPRATHQIYETAENLKDKGWTYTMEGSFVEVYNEEIHDLLGSSKDMDKKKHEIRHDDQKKQTIVTGLKTVTLTSADTVESILKQAANNRSVAATKSNERSSRSHSVFILKLIGRNSTTNETSEGTLNLVDLAGSERLKQSGAEGDRMKETQNINKSLSCLGDVIGALGQGKEGAHIPYRNSKLTYLLQYSLGGNSKTLMFVMASPLQEHVSETLTSLKFATKVHNTHIGTAKRSTKVRDRNSE
ncbi:P-loop containing nucleoside triphosphate hydrolase [Glarea lozoyensis ATCC 20868]|uniref:Kinesin-like protein n=1 Tax=Glarea lozoyensis (strain ATCC 20868 / MF5171) TaxID=1116229 RepID=S3DQ93_GLAL2|nr:P-loop containing nucleoside triphosphate hydrolase [Glarea lozoyensis ATCC 20868]EPE28653.1 P-loop containing nucleoside triphosphate hydrolase [Glarea lozoyensis ATCC 20868]